jgi:hypothetical protein
MPIASSSLEMLSSKFQHEADEKMVAANALVMRSAATKVEG